MTNTESLNQAIRNYNRWDKGAKIWLDVNTGIYATTIYPDNKQASAARPLINCICVHSKSETYGDTKISDEQRKRIESYARVVLDGKNILNAEYYILGAN